MQADIENLAEIFKALSNSLRLKIVIGLLEKSECNVNLMAEKLNISQPNVSQHLTILKNAGIIEGYRKGTQICYKVTNELVATIVKSICPQGTACNNTSDCKYVSENYSEDTPKIKDGKCLFCDDCQNRV